MFDNPSEVLSAAYLIIKNQYREAWISWRKIPSTKKDDWFEEFKDKFFWKDKHSVSVHRNWKRKCSQFLITTLSKARKKGTKPSWITRSVWNEMLKLWEAEDFKKISEANKLHRACVKGPYAGGARNTHQHEKENKRRMTQGRLMKKLYRKNESKEWTCTKPQETMDRFKELCKSFNDEHSEGMTEDDKRRLWAEAGGDYGQGSLHRKVSQYRNPGALSYQASSTGLDNNQLREFRKSIEENLRKSMEEELRKSITEEVHKTMDEKFQQIITQVRQQERMRAQQQMNRYVQSLQQMTYDPLLQTDTPLMTLLNSSSNPLDTPTVQINSSDDTSGYRPTHPSGYN